MQLQRRMSLKKLKIYSADSVLFELEKRRLENDLFKFTLWVFKNVYKRDFKENWHHRTLCQILMDIHSGKLCHTIITLPPRYTKTEIVVKIFPAWCYLKNKSCEFLHLAYSDDLALSNSSVVKQIIESVEFQSLWPIEFKLDTTAKKKWKTIDGGEFSAAASGGSVIGFGAGKFGVNEFSGALIVDDPLKPDDAKSDTKRNHINARFPETIKSRLNDRKTPMIIVMQRLHEDDPVGFLLGGGIELNFTHINLPAINEDGKSEYDIREIGEALWPDKHTAEELEEMRKKSAMVYAGQYQQRPAPAEGNIFKVFKFYYELPQDIFIKVHSWDFTFKKSKNSDYVVGSNWGKSKSKDIYLIDLVRSKMSFTESLEAIKHFAKKHSDYNAILVEAKANGEAIIDSIKSEVRKVIPVNPTSSKEERAEAISPMFEAGEIYLPHPSIAPWVEDYISEMKVFPNGKHDDQVDSSTQAIEFLDKRNSIGGMEKANRNKPETFRKAFEGVKNKRTARKGKIKINSY